MTSMTPKDKADIREALDKIDGIIADLSTYSASLGLVNVLSALRGKDVPVDKIVEDGPVFIEKMETTAPIRSAALPRSASLFGVSASGKVSRSKQAKRLPGLDRYYGDHFLVHVSMAADALDLWDDAAAISDTLAVP